MNTLLVVLQLFDVICQLLVWGLIAWAVLSWLIAFNVVNTSNRAVYTISNSLDRLFNPILRPIRRLLPDMGGVDLSPMALVLLIMLVQRGVPAVLADAGVLPGLVIG
jgi:YggT family protein